MKIPMSWLRCFVELDEGIGIKEFMDTMTMSGSMAEGFETLGGDISGVTAGRVLTIERHSGADKLFVTMVDIGRGKPLQIVTGAANLAVGDYVPIATDGAVLAGGKEIKSGMLRGVLSEGMLCSIEELGYTRDDYPEAPEDGIYVFRQPVFPGDDPVLLLELKEDVVEFELTSNRPDCFSIYGMAREAAAVFGAPLKTPEIQVKEEAGGNVSDLIRVEIKNPGLCPRYCARVVRDVKIEPSPQWMRRRLTAAGLKPINNIVDITNYVMLELGQPMHAFDIGCIRGGKVIVRNASEGEQVVTLDGVKRKLDTSMLVIADTERAIAVAGIMGGEDSKITGGAGTVLLESANFDGVNVRLTAKALGLRTDSSSRFEKRLDPNLPIVAINRAAELIELLDAGKVVPGVADAYPVKREPQMVCYSPGRINRLLGTSIPEQEMESLLSRLGISAAGGEAKIPAFRPDITEEADIAEEVGRLYGYNNIETTLAAGTPTIGGTTPEQHLKGVLRECMTALGYFESLSFAFESPKVFDKLIISPDSGLRAAASIKNPLGEDYAIMRTMTAPSMLSSLALNFNRRNDEARLYEISRIYIPCALPLDKLPSEIEILTFGAYGSEDYYGMKGITEYILQSLGANSGEAVFSRESETIKNPPHDLALPFLHPGRMAYISFNGEILGYIGEVHPTVSENYGLDVKTCLGVLYVDVLMRSANMSPLYKPLPKFPGIRRDIALVIDSNVPVEEIRGAIRASGGEYLEDVQLFDVYQGKNMEHGKHSLAFALSFRHPDKTLTDEQAAGDVQNILALLKEKFNAVLRDK